MAIAVALTIGVAARLLIRLPDFLRIPGGPVVIVVFLAESCHRNARAERENRRH